MAQGDYRSLPDGLVECNGLKLEWVGMCAIVFLNELIMDLLDCLAVTIDLSKQCFMTILPNGLLQLGKELFLCIGQTKFYASDVFGIKRRTWDIQLDALLAIAFWRPVVNFKCDDLAITAFLLALMDGDLSG